jgi:outer membrane protein OmpA-like peptidoglycan-associated protein
MRRERAAAKRDNRGRIVMSRIGVLIAGVLGLVLTLGFSDARAATNCPPHSNGVPGPFYVLFAVGSYKIDADGMAKIKQAAKLAKDLYIRTVCVRGKADKQGNADYNLTLSAKRAHAVAAALVKEGVDAKTLLVFDKGEGYGDSVNIMDNSQIDRSARISLTK